MTDERALLLAVADAATELRLAAGAVEPTYRPKMDLWTTLDALAAYRAQQKGDEAKTVEVRAVVVMSPCGEFWTIAGLTVGMTRMLSVRRLHMGARKNSAPPSSSRMCAHLRFPP